MRISDCGSRPSWFAWRAAGLALLVGTAVTSARTDVTDSISRVITVPPGAPISVQITVGYVAVHGWDRSDASVDVVRRARDAQHLDRIPAQVEHGADGLVVRAVQAEGGRDPSMRTEVTLRVPRASHLRDVEAYEGRIDLSNLRGVCAARLERGDIVAKQVRGSIRLETVIGNIRLERATLAPDGAMRLRTFNGNVALELAAVPRDARILALSLGGTITSDIPLTSKQRWGPRFGETTLGKGEPVISIDVVNGNVAITVAGGAR